MTDHIPDAGKIAIVDVIAMAREASNTPIDHHATPDLVGKSQIERFAELVRADEREAIVEAIHKLMMEVDQAPRTASTKMASSIVHSIGNQFVELIHARSNT